MEFTRNKRQQRCSGRCRAAASVATRVSAAYQSGVSAAFDAITSTLLDRGLSEEEARELRDAATAIVAHQPTGPPGAVGAKPRAQEREQGVPTKQ